MPQQQQTITLSMEYYLKEKTKIRETNLNKNNRINKNC